MSRTTSPGTRRRTRAGTVAAGVIAVGAMTVIAAPGLSTITGAADPTVTPIVVDGSAETHPIVSDDGSVVLLTSTLPVPDPPVDAAEVVDVPAPATVVRLHDRADATTIDLPDANARFAALSGDGCTVAYGVPIPAEQQPGDDGSADQNDATVDTGDGADPTVAASPDPGAGETTPVDAPPPQFEVRVVDRCAGTDPAPGADPDPGVDPGTQPAVEPLTSVIVATTPLVAPLALDRAGLTLVANTGDDIVRLTRLAATETEPATPFAEAERFDLVPVATEAAVTSGSVDVNDDGSVVVYSAAPAAPDDGTQPAPPAIHVWAGGEVALIAEDASDPSISGDGAVVAFDVQGTPGGSLDGVTIIELRSDGVDLRRVLIDPAGDLPYVSADGTHLFYVVAIGDAPGLRRASWAADGVRPFDSVVTTDLGLPIEGDERLGVPGTTPSASRHGDVIANDVRTIVDAGDVQELGDVLVRTAPATASFDAARYDLGVGAVGTTLTGVATLGNDGSSTIDLDSAAIAVGSPFALVPPGADSSEACVGLLRPGATCSLQIDYEVAAAIDTVADITVTAAGDETPLATATVGAVGTPDTTTTTSSSTTTTRVPVVTTPSTTPNTTRTTTRNTTRTTTQNTTRVTTTTTTTTTIPAPPTLSPATFEFAPTIIDAGRRVAAFSVGNPRTTSVQVIDVAVEPVDSGFAIVDGSTCAGATLTSGASCQVDVEFAPVVEGPSSVTIVASFDDGTVAQAAVTGFGAPPPVVDLVPGVANTGQVVTLRGSGFPAGAVVDVNVSSEAIPRSVTVSDVGAFDLPLVILPNTMPGPLVVSVTGQPDLFPTVETSLLVTATNDRTSPAVLRGVGPNIGR